MSDCYAPRTGGIETQVRGLVQQQARSGRDVMVVTATPGSGAVRSGEDHVDGVRVHRVAARIPFELPVHPRTAHHVGEILTSRRPDVVHVHVGAVSPFAWGGVRAAIACGIPVLATVHSVWGPVARPGYGLSEALLKWSEAGVELSAVSQMAADRVARALRGRREVHVLSNGIEPEDWRLDHRVPATAGEFRVVSVMRMAARKRVGALARILALAATALAPHAELRATLIGDGPERARAEKWLARQGLAPQVEFTGRLDRSGILEVFQRSDAYVQPSVKESFGIAALEARTAGLPVIVRSQSGSVQFVHDGLEGLVVDDDAQMASAIVRMARDPDLVRRISQHNAQQPPRETWPVLLDDVDRAYGHAMARRPGQLG